MQVLVAGVKLRLPLAISWLAAWLALAAISCGGDDGGGGWETGAPTGGLPPPAVDRSDYPLKIVVSMPILADMAHIVGGNQVQVTTLIPPGENPHTYVPSDDLADEVAAADIVFYNGLGLEEPTERFIEQNLAPRPPLVIEIVRNVPSPSTEQPVNRPIYAKDVGDDPHLFLDPALVHVYAETISHSMIIQDGANTSFYDSRYQAYKQQIAAMDQATMERLSAIPDASKALLVTQHNSLIWYARRYGLSVAGTLDGDGEGGLREKLSSLHPPAVFSETGFDASTLNELADEAGIDVCNIETDTVENAETSYLEMMDELSREIARCLA